MRSLFILTLLIICCQTIIAQKNDTIKFKSNVAGIDVLGNMGTLYSFNYERKLFENQSGMLTARLGLFPYQYTHTNKFKTVETGLGTYILVNYIFSKGKNHVELGAGIRIWASDYYNSSGVWISKFGLDEENTIATGNLMYRRQKPNGKFLYKIGWTPQFYRSTDAASFAYIFFVGMGLGYIF